jgi:hypothetical protein
MNKTPSHLLLVSLLAISAGSLLAQENAVDNPAEVDFQVQGEYEGVLRSGLLPRPVGLQVIALGEGQFDGVLYTGGLPGTRRNEPSASTLHGKLDGQGRLVLQGDQMLIEILQGRGTIQDSQQRESQLHKVVRQSSTMSAPPPRNALVLFDGSMPEHFQNARVTEDGLLMEGVTTTMPVGDFQLHLEFRIPFMPQARGQARGNSGVYIQRRYEVQILDSFGLSGANNECGGLYRQQQPRINMCLPPLAWQTYDVLFREARWEGDEKTENAHITVLHNGVPIHWKHPITNKTGAGQKEEAKPLPLHLQNHGNPVRFRNVWLVMDKQKLGARVGRARITQQREKH